MGETKPVPVGTLQRGSYVVIDGIACRISGTTTSRPGKHGHAKVRLEGVGLLDGKKRIIVAPGHDHVDVPIIGKKAAQVLSVTGDTANLMDSESYETFDLPIPEELKGQVIEGGTIVYWVVLDDKVMKSIKAE